MATVSVFYAPGRTETVSCKLASLRRSFPGPETRAYVISEGRWLVGRIKDYFPRDDGLVSFQIRFPNSEERHLVETEIDVRSWKSPGDPTTVLAAGSAESQFLHDRRRRASEHIVALHAAAQGMSSLLSSAIDLVPHQISAVRRILSDPLQRYLLADEVGMGKTIEACIIIRQVLIDDPTLHVTVIVPDSLLLQWNDELYSRFRSADFGASLVVLPYSRIAEASHSSHLLVVDEAHRVIHDVRLRQLALSARKLLLLSATPVIDNEPLFLSLLNLLDPENYRTENLESFRAKVAETQEFGRLLLGLQPGGLIFVLKARLAEACRRFPQDEIVLALAERALTELQSGNPEDAAASCKALQFHIADTYRIYQRVIRSRRSDIFGSGTRARDAALPTASGIALSQLRLEVDEDERYSLVAAAIEDWREAVVAASDSFSAAVRMDYAKHFLAIIDAAAQGLDEVVNASEVAAAEGVYNCSKLATTLEEIRQLAPGPRSRVDVAHDSLKLMRQAALLEHASPKIVAFASGFSTAAALYSRFNPRSAVLFGGGTFDVIERFLVDPHTWLLICDASGEEGLNLQFAHAILHVDLPISPGRMEQRIGRLDRFGRTVGGIQQRVILSYDEDGSVWEAWFRVLAEGFQVFTRSISDVQFALGSVVEVLAEAALERGSNGLIEAIPIVRERLTVERERQDEQYALDEIALAESPTERFVADLSKAERAEAAFEKDMEGWLLQVMHLHKRPSAWPSSDPFFLDWTARTVVPTSPWKSQFGRDLTRKLSWHRATAMAAKDVSLLRPGTPLIDGSERYMRWDDRGTTFATWRVEPSFITGDDLWTGFRLCFIVEPGTTIDNLTGTNSEAWAVRRQAQAYFPPWSRTIHIDARGEVVKRVDLLEILERPYQNKRSGNDSYDVNLGSRLELLYEVVDAAELSSLCSSVKSNAERLLKSDPRFIDNLAEASTRAKEDTDKKKQRLQQRIQAYPNARRELETELARNELVLDSVLKPRILLDAVGFFVVAGYAPA